MEIPPIGPQYAQDIAQYVDLLVMESDQDAQRVRWSQGAVEGFSLYMGDQWDEEEDARMGIKRITMNRIQNVAVSMMAIQAADPPQVEFVPRESGDESVVYVNVNLPEGKVLAARMQASAMQSGVEWDPSLPLDDKAAADIRSEIDAGELMVAQAQMMGMPAPAVLPKEVLVEVNDRTAAETVQVVFDAMWEECGAQQVFVDNILNKNVYGWQPCLYEFDDELKRHRLTNVHPLQVFPDPLRTGSDRSSYVVYDEPMFVDEAVARWPDRESEIRDYAKQGQPKWEGSQRYASASLYSQDFQRNMIVVRTAWIRFQRYPVDEAKAVREGLVKQALFSTGNRVLDESGMETDEVVGGYAHPETGEAMEYGSGSWPMEQGIRQITILAGTVVDDRRCEFADIPLPWNRNIPVPFSPYADGEPVRLKGLQRALNLALSSVVSHHAYNAYPPELVPQSVAEEMGPDLRGSRSKPGQRIQIPDYLITQLGGMDKVMMTLDSPTIGPDAWKLVQLMIDLIDREGNQADVMQGNASATWSGEAISSLQNAASQVIRAKSMHTEGWLKQVAGLMFHSIVTRMEAEDWRRYLGRYPWQAIQAFHDRAKGLYVDVSVVISSGAGASKQAKTNNLVAARNSGAPVSDPTLLENLGLDPDVEMTRGAEWQRKMSSRQALPGVQMGTNPAGGTQVAVGG